MSPKVPLFNQRRVVGEFLFIADVIFGHEINVIKTAVRRWNEKHKILAGPSSPNTFCIGADTIPSQNIVVVTFLLAR